jgi:hypothetical protein
VGRARGGDDQEAPDGATQAVCRLERSGTARLAAVGVLSNAQMLLAVTTTSPSPTSSRSSVIVTTPTRHTTL